MTGEPSQLPSELRTLVKRYGTRVLDDADGLRATLDDFLDEGSAAPGDVNLLVDAVRFGSLDRLRTLLGQGADPAAATTDVGEALAQRRGGDAESAYWACAVLGYAADLLPADLVPGTWERPSSQLPPAVTATSTTSTPSPAPDDVQDTTYLVDQTVTRQGVTDDTDGSPAATSPDQSAAVPGPADRPAKRRRPWALVAGILVAALIVAAGIYLVFIRGGDNNNGETAQDMGTSGCTSQSTSLLQTLCAANEASNGMLPVSTCTSQSATHVVCSAPDPTGAEQADFQTYASLKDLYGAYQARATSLGGRPLRTNVDNCSGNSPEGEVSWNHSHQHPTSYSLAQLQGGTLDPDHQAAGRVFCVLDGTTETFLWTQNDGMILGEVTGAPHPLTWQWWKEVHHDIAEVGMSNMSMSPSP